MNFTAADQTAILTAIGENVTVDDVSVLADFRLGGQLVQLYDGSVETSKPYLRVSSAHYATGEIDHGSYVTARGVDYTVVGVQNEGNGFWRLDLQAVDQ